MTDEEFEEIAECPVCGAIIPGDAKVCPECGAVFDEEEDTTAVALEEEEEEEDLEEDVEEEEEEDFEENLPQKANRKLFWAGLISLIIGSQIVALGSFVHNKLRLFTSEDNQWTKGSYAVYGPYDQMVGIIGIVMTLLAFFLIFVYMKQQRDEEKYRKEIEEEGGKIADMEPPLVQNKLFFWIGLGLLLFTGPLGVIFGFATDDPSAGAGTAGIASGSLLTIIGFVLIFLAIRDALLGTKKSEEDDEGDDEDEESEEEDEEEIEDMEPDEEEELEEDFEDGEDL